MGFRWIYSLLCRGALLLGGGSLASGERLQLQFMTAAGEVRLVVKASEMQLGGETVKILTINDIKNELDAKELDTWIKLTRVLTHEIMNSVAPMGVLTNLRIGTEHKR